MTPIISVVELKKRWNEPELVILDATIPKVAGAAAVGEKRRIKGARFFDIKKAFSDTKSTFPNTLPPAAQFERECQKLGIDTNSTIIVYDDWGIYSSPRAWWMFKTMGHKNVAVLDGGLPEWKKRGYETEPITEQVIPPGNFQAQFNPDAVKDFDFIQSNIKESSAVVVDARSADRFYSRVPEPRADLRSGHIDGSLNIPYTDVLEEGRFKSTEQLQEVFRPLSLESRPLVFSCGSGITACVVALASEFVLANDKAIYDGSWTEYALRTS